ncbi:MAG: NADH:ubiquinone reductase (Na(+)-transporting) subunit C [Cyclobacteriaceae bacterium]
MIILTIVLGGLLSGANQFLKDAQDKSIELDTKKKILGAVMDISTLTDGQAILDKYDERVKSVVVDINGDLVTKDDRGNPVVAEKVNIQKQNRFDPEDRLYPVFMFMDDQDSEKVDSYIFPMWGSGLWDWISGFLAVKSDLRTVAGVAFDHKTETPGLGARISDQTVQNRYKEKYIYDENGELKPVSMVKGEGNADLSKYEVDGLSGATMTAKGVNNMIDSYLRHYEPYIEKVKNDQKVAVK